MQQEPKRTSATTRGIQLGMLLACGMLALMGATGTPWPALNTLVGSEAITIKVAAASDLSSLSALTLRDEMLVEIADGYCPVRYDAGSSSTVDNVFVWDGPGSVGRFHATDTKTCYALRSGIVAADNGTSDVTQFTRMLNSGASRLVVEKGVTVNVPAWTAWATDRDLTIICEGTIEGDGTDDIIQVDEGDSLWLHGNGTGEIRDTKFAILLDNAATTHKTVVIDGMNFQDCAAGLMDAGAIESIERLRVTDCDFDDGALGVICRAEIHVNTEVARCTFTDFAQSSAGTDVLGVMIGNDDATNHGSVSIHDLYFEDFSNTNNSAQTHFLFLFGRNFSVRDIEGRELVGTGTTPVSQGVYCKTSYSTFEHIRLHNATGGEGGWSFKGDDRGESAGSPDGWSNACRDVHITADDNPQVPAFHCTTHCTLLDACKVEGFQGAILLDGANNSQVSNSEIRVSNSGTTNIGVLINSSSHVKIIGNEFPDFGHASQVSWMVATTTPANATDILIMGNTGNVIGSDRRFVQLQPASGISVSNVNIVGNIIHDTWYGLYFNGAPGGTHSSVSLANNQWPGLVGVPAYSNDLSNGIASVNGNPADVYSITAVATTGQQIFQGQSRITVTSAASSRIVILPPPIVGTKITGYVGSNGFELWASGSSVKINDVVCSATNQLAIPATTLWEAECTSTTTWLVTGLDKEGDVISPLTPDAR